MEKALSNWPTDDLTVTPVVLRGLIAAVDTMVLVFSCA